MTTLQQRYGLGATTRAGTPEGAASIADGTDEVFLWERSQRVVSIYNHRDSGVDIYVVWNGETAALDDYDVMVEPGQLTVNPGGISVQRVAIWADGGFITLGGSLAVRGYGS